MKHPIKLKSLTLAMLAWAFTLTATAAPVTFWFSARVTELYNPSNAMPADIQIGTPIAGRWMFDSATAGYVAGVVDQSGSVSNFYCPSVAGYAALVQIGPHVITNTATLPGWSGYLNIYDNYNNADELYLYAGQAGLMQDGTLLTNSSVRIYLRDNSKAAFASAQFPTDPPVLAAFPDEHVLTWEVRTPSSALVYKVTAQLTAISTNELVLLNIRNASANTAQVSWPIGVSGMSLQSATNLAAPAWQNVVAPITDISMEHTVTVSTIGTPNFYRLKK